MKFYNKFRGAVSVLNAHINKYNKIPLSIYFFITYKCPFSCRYCNITKNVSTKKELETPDIIDIINQMADAKTLKLHLTGGEPMIREDIGEIIEAAKQRDMFVGISTSGYLVADKIDDLKSIDLVLLSLDGDKDVHDYLRGTGSFRIVQEAMKALKSHGIKYWTTTVLNKKNKDSIDFILNWAEHDGFVANFVMLHSRDDNYSTCFNNRKEAENFLMSTEESHRVLTKLIEKKRKKISNRHLLLIFKTFVGME